MDGQTEICLYFITVLLLNYIDITHTHTHIVNRLQVFFLLLLFFSNFLISVTYAYGIFFLFKADYIYVWCGC